MCIIHLNGCENRKRYESDQKMLQDDDEDCLPIPRRSLIDRHQITTHHFSSDNESSPSDRRRRRQSRISFNNSISIDSGIDEHISTPKQLIALYEKTLELAAKNKINVKNAFQIPLVERLPELLNIIGFDDKLQSIDGYHEPNFVKVGHVIDTSAKIYGLRVDALHTETQRLSGSIQPQEEEESVAIDSDQSKPMKKPVQHCKSKTNSYIVSDLSTISLLYEFDFHPLQPSNMCKWPGGIGCDSVYADMVSYTMYSSSDFPLINSFIDLNSRMNIESVENENILDVTSKTICDLIPLREVIKDSEGENHILGCSILREFTFNDEPTESYIETIDECSIMDSLDYEDDQNILSDLRDEPTSFYFQELQSTYTGPMTMPSMDMTLLQSRISFVDQVPHLLREKTDSSEYSYFDVAKLKLFAGPYLWKYTNLLPDSFKPTLPTPQTTFFVQSRRTNNPVHNTMRNFKLDYLNQRMNRSLNELMALNPLSKSILKRPRRTTLTLSSFPKHNHQLRLTRRLCPITDLIKSNNFSESIFDEDLENPSNDYDDCMMYDDPPPIPDGDDHPFEYDFIRPIHYDKIEFDRNLTKVDTKKLQYRLVDEYHTESLNSSLSSPVTFSTLCVKLLEKKILSIDKTELISAFYCMLNNCNKSNLFMKNTFQQDDLIIQNQPFLNSVRLSYSHKLF